MAIQQRFGAESRSAYNQDHQRSSSRDRFANNAPRHDNYQSYGSNYSRNIEVDNEWDDAQSKPQAPREFKSNPYKSSSSADWEAEQYPPVYQPSANTYQRSYDDQPKQFSRGRGRGSFSSGFGQSEPRSSYSNSGRAPYRSHDSSSVRSNIPAEPEQEFEVIDWEKANAECEAARKIRWESCPKLIKDFYMEHPEVTNMSDEDAEKFRLENMHIAVSRTFADEGSTEAMPKPTTKFEHAWGNFPDLMGEIRKAGFERPSPIQSQMWPILLAGEDCIGIAQTGTGKTLAFLLPAMIHTDGQPHPRGIAARGGPNVLVLAPTRELAIQIEKEVAKYQFRGIRA